MAQLVVGGVTIPVARGNASRDRDDFTDRRRSFDGTYRASQTGGAARTWRFRTPPITRVLADTYEATLGIVAAQMCSGDLLGIPTMCCAQIDSGWNAIKAASGHYVELPFTLHEVQPAKLLLKYAPGDTITGESFTRSNIGTYFNASGLLVAAGVDVKRDGHYVNGVRSLLLEDTRTNVVLWNRDMTNAAWTKSSMNPAKDQVGIDGTSNVASSILATGANATVSQGTTVGSSARAQFAYVKRLIGSGTIQMTMDNGTTWTNITVTASYTKVTIPTQTLANPIVGFRIVTSGDKIAVDYVQNENGTFDSSPIATTTTAIARGADSYSLPFTTPPQEMTVYAKFVEGGAGLTASAARVWEIATSGDATPRLLGYAAGGYSTLHDKPPSVASVIAALPAIGDTIELMSRLFGDGSVDTTQSLNGAAATSAAQSAANALATAWSDDILWLNSVGATNIGYIALQSFKIVAGARSLTEMQTL